MTIPAQIVTVSATTENLTPKDAKSATFFPNLCVLWIGSYGVKNEKARHDNGATGLAAGGFETAFENGRLPGQGMVWMYNPHNLRIFYWYRGFI
jgi:hypothetical protein